MNQTTSETVTPRSVVSGLSNSADRLGKAARGALLRLGESGTAFFQELVKTGESLQAKNSAGSKASQARNAADDWRHRLAGVLGLPTREEIDSLGKKLERINRKVNKLARERAA